MRSVKDNVHFSVLLRNWKDVILSVPSGWQTYPGDVISVIIDEEGVGALVVSVDEASFEIQNTDLQFNSSVNF